MRKTLNVVWRIFSILSILILSNFIILKYVFPSCWWLLILAAPIFAVFNVIPSINAMKKKQLKIMNCQSGIDLLLIFIGTTIFNVIFEVVGWLGAYSGSVWYVPGIAYEFNLWAVNAVFTIIVEAVVFWNGIIRIYITSTQLGIKLRVIGALCGMIPVVNFFVLIILIATVKDEIDFETKKYELNEARKNQQICKTKYPIVMVHGVFFRDFRYFNYWGRIPDELILNGATIYYGDQQSAESVAYCGQEVANKIKSIVEETGCEKVNIIAHSKGGLDSRYALSKLGIGPYVASLTTINTPHRGCEFADYLLHRIPADKQKLIADSYNKALKLAGDAKPDFMAAVSDLTASACSKFNEEVLNVDGVYYQSYGSTVRNASAGRFPLNYSSYLVNAFDGKNDGLVGEKSFPWGEKFTMLSAKGVRGISHGDVIDLNRENFDGFDVREFFVQLVSELREKGF